MGCQEVWCEFFAPKLQRWKGTLWILTGKENVKDFVDFFVGFANFGGLVGRAGNESFWSIVGKTGVRCGVCARHWNLEMRTKLEKECGGIIGVGFEWRVVWGVILGQDCLIKVKSRQKRE